MAASGWESTFDQQYPPGRVFVFPQLYSTKLKVFKNTKDQVPDDPVVPPVEEVAENPTPSKQPRMIQEIDEVKLKRSEDRLRGDMAEVEVIKMLLRSLEAIQDPTDLPCFLLNDLDENTFEIDVIILHPKIGVVLLETKAGNKPRNLDKVGKAARQLDTAEKKVREKLEGLLRPEAVIIHGVGLPNLQAADMGDDNDRMKKVLERHPEVKFLYGSEADVYRQWLTQLKSSADSQPKSSADSLPKSAGPQPWGSHGMDSTTAFKMAVSRYLLMIRPSSPASALRQLAAVHRSWVLTPEQVEVRDRRDRLLHIWGPPGSGKTLLIILKARQQLKEGGAVLLKTGYPDYDVLLSHLGRSILDIQGQCPAGKLRFCCQFQDIRSAVEELLQENRGLKPEQICLITDELRYDAFKTLLEAAKEHKEITIWSASVPDFPDISRKLSKEAEDLSWNRVNIPASIRCPEYIVRLLNQLVKGSTSKSHDHIQAYEVLPTLAFRKARIIRHYDHQGYTPLDRSPEMTCEACRQELGEALSTLGKDFWRHLVVLGTGEVGYTDPVIDALVTFLQGLGVPAVWERQNTRTNRVATATLTPGAQPGPESEVESWRRRVVAGTDQQGCPAVHGLKVVDFLGLEKPAVVLVHWDPMDDDVDCQGEENKKSRMSDHADQWMSAMSRCQGQLVLLLLSPSPAAALLDPCSPS